MRHFCISGTCINALVPRQKVFSSSYFGEARYCTTPGKKALHSSPFPYGPKECDTFSSVEDGPFLPSCPVQRHTKLEFKRRKGKERAPRPHFHRAKQEQTLFNDLRQQKHDWKKIKRIPPQREIWSRSDGSHPKENYKWEKEMT